LDRSCSHDVTNHANVSFICQKQPEETSTTPSETTTEEGSTKDSETTTSVQPPVAEIPCDSPYPVFAIPGITIVSPNYPNYYGNNLDCQVTIDAIDAGVTIEFQDFSTESNYDYLRIYDGDSNSSHLIRTIDGHSIPNPIHSTGTAITLNFQSDSSNGDRGFSIATSRQGSPATKTSVAPTTESWTTEVPVPSFEKLELTHCTNHKYGEFSNVEEAKNSCIRDANCKGVYDYQCDESIDDVYLCMVGYDYETSQSSCVYDKSSYV